VDKAEQEESQKAYELNSDAVGYIAEAAESVGATLVHYSTGFVFEGSEEKGYNEDANPDPQSVYGKSKLGGEQQAEKCSKYYIIRLNLLFGQGGSSVHAKKSFPDMILELAKEKKEFDFVTDEISTPTYAVDLAKATIELVKKPYPYGIYHLPNDGKASWYEFAEEVFKDKGIEVKLNKVNSEQFVRPAKRPKNSVLLNTKFPKLRTWQEALKEYLESK
jgi:dTDP-4-dehydrorhamnose reductase